MQQEVGTVDVLIEFHAENNLAKGFISFERKGEYWLWQANATKYSVYIFFLHLYQYFVTCVVRF